MFLAPKFFWGRAPEFLEWDYKIQPDSDHVAKFQGDRSRELGERVAKQKNKDTSAVKHKPVRNGGSGRPKKLQAIYSMLNKRQIENRKNKKKYKHEHYEWIFVIQRGRDYSWSNTFQICDTLSRLWGIRD